MAGDKVVQNQQQEDSNARGALSRMQEAAGLTDPIPSRADHAAPKNQAGKPVTPGVPGAESTVSRDTPKGAITGSEARSETVARDSEKPTTKEERKQAASALMDFKKAILDNLDRLSTDRDGTIRPEDKTNLANATSLLDRASANILSGAPLDKGMTSEEFQETGGLVMLGALLKEDGQIRTDGISYSPAQAEEKKAIFGAGRNPSELAETRSQFDTERLLDRAPGSARNENYKALWKNLVSGDDFLQERYGGDAQKAIQDLGGRLDSIGSLNRALSSMDNLRREDQASQKPSDNNPFPDPLEQLTRAGTTAKLNPIGEGTLRYQLARAYESNGQPDQAIAQYKQAAKGPSPEGISPDLFKAIILYERLS